MLKISVSGFSGLTSGWPLLLLKHDALADHQLLELVGSPAPRDISGRRRGRRACRKGPCRDDDAVEDVFEQRRCRLLGNDFHRVIVERDDFLDRAGVLLLLALRIGVDPVDGMHHVLGGELLAVILALGAALEMERPDVLVGLVDLPSLGQHADVVGLFVVVDPETAVDLAPDGVAHRDAVGIRIEARDRLGHADRRPGRRRWPSSIRVRSIAVVATDAIKINARRLELDFILISPATHA